GMPCSRRCPLANWPRISVGNWAPPPKERKGPPAFWYPGNVVGPFRRGICHLPSGICHLPSGICHLPFLLTHPRSAFRIFWRATHFLAPKEPRVAPIAPVFVQFTLHPDHQRSPIEGSSRLMGTFAWAALGLALVGLSVVLYAKLKAGYSRKTRRLQVDLERGGGKELFVMVPGCFFGSRIFDDARKVIRATRADADLMLVDFPPPSFSNADPFEIAVELSDAIDTQVVGSPYASVTLVGYCMGALLARKAFVYGCNKADDDPLWNSEAAEKDWVERVDRFVLMAGPNRGFNPAPEKMGRLMLLNLKLGKVFNRLTGTARLLWSCERGQPFVANLRVQWIRTAREREAKGRHWPSVVQLLGTGNDVVGYEDHKDVTVSQDFIFVPLRGTGHDSILDFRDPAYGGEREM